MVAESGVREQLHELYRDHHAWLFDWLRRRLGCRHNAADVAQDTFERLLASRNALQGQRIPIDEPRAYLTTTARRLLIDRARREQVERAYLEALHARAQDVAGYPSPEQIMEAVQALAHICAVLEGVSARARAAFLLHYLDGWTHADVATHLGVSAKMVQKYLVQVLLHCHSQSR
ncbi:RNA polymerase subunit sigma [Corticimicrobacter populi]|uniref:RNA polymerase subunit sigma n=1 Tax=Corticimicrobacter populi TaxID=2175229 RepID=A0A2V1JWN7_9BURK|nr:RNA polymerase subunit sigma [Corticimicrobacter populi]